MDFDLDFFSVATKKGGTEQFQELIGGRAPDPDKAAASFRESRSLMLEATIDELNFLPSIFLERGARGGARGRPDRRPAGARPQGCLARGRMEGHRLSGRQGPPADQPPCPEFAGSLPGGDLSAQLPESP
jgi:hypothetical protein